MKTFLFYKLVVVHFQFAGGISQKHVDRPVQIFSEDDGRAPTTTVYK